MSNIVTSRPRLRLPLEIYSRLDTVCFVTAAVERRRPVFREPSVGLAAAEVLRRRAQISGVKVFAYCVMPDHVHIALSPSTSKDIIAFVGEFKNLAQREAWKRGVVGAFWQESFWDHCHRFGENVDVDLNYIMQNPVRGGLVKTAEDYPFSALSLDGILPSR